MKYRARSPAAAGILCYSIAAIYSSCATIVDGQDATPQWPSAGATALSSRQRGSASDVSGVPDTNHFDMVTGETVAYDLNADNLKLVNGDGVDFNMYENAGSVENHKVDVLVSADGSKWINVDNTMVAGGARGSVAIKGDEKHGSTQHRIGYDIGGTGLPSVRYIRILGTSNAMDLDAVGYRYAVPCDGCTTSTVTTSTVTTSTVTTSTVTTVTTSTVDYKETPQWPSAGATALSSRQRGSASDVSGVPDTNHFDMVTGETVAYDLNADNLKLVNGDGVDFNMYENAGSVENHKVDVLVSADGSKWINVDNTMVAGGARGSVAIKGDEKHGSTQHRIGYDIGGTGLPSISFIPPDVFQSVHPSAGRSKPPERSPFARNTRLRRFR